MRYWLALLLTVMVTVIMAQNSQPVKVGLSLSGGGARCFSEIGLLKVLDEAGLQPECIAGTSMGGFVGTLYSMGYSGEQIEQIVLSVNWEELLTDTITRHDRYISQKRTKPLNNFQFRLDDNFKPQLPQGFVGGENMMLMFFRLTWPVQEYADFSQLPIPISIVSTDLISGEARIFEQGNLAQALRATVAVPSILEPFELDGHYYIDGGVSMNLPVEPLKAAGCNYIIGCKANSPLRNPEQLSDLFRVLDQTINIAMTEKVEKAEQECNIVIAPELDGISSYTFANIKQIIDQGEEAARHHLMEFRELASTQTPRSRCMVPLYPTAVYFNKIKVTGNRYFTSDQILMYTRLQKKELYTPEKIANACKEAFDSGFFNYIYPTVDHTADGYNLIIHVKEKPRQHLGVNITYNNHEKLVLGTNLCFDNYLGKNSQLLAQLDLGGRQELLFDYICGFGKRRGVYMHLFPYVQESSALRYNDEHEKVASTVSLEYGGTLGLGAFSPELGLMEGYIYSYHQQLYQDIAFLDLDNSQYYSSGLGLKLYHETLDDYVFPMKGFSLLGKYNHAQKDLLSDYDYDKVKVVGQGAVPITEGLTLLLKADYGRYLNKQSNTLDPFYVGGYDSFLGFYSQEYSAPVYKLGSVALRKQIAKDFFVDMQANAVNFSEKDVWRIKSKDYLWGVGVKLGYRSVIGPLRYAVSYNWEGNWNQYLSLGYDFDAFEFSRR